MRLRLHLLAALVMLPHLFLGAQPRPSRSGARGTFEVTEASLTELQQAMTSGRVTAAQLVDAYLARIAAYDQAGPALNAMIRLNPRARAVAELLDAERRSGKVRGPLHGIPIVLKDNYDTRDMNTSGGSVALASHRPRTDADVVARLRDAGAVILGKTNLHELAAGITSISSLGGQPRNPYDLGRCPGGSSGGTGVAVAASFAAIGWGTDTCGSIRIPAAFASLVGLRPTQGLFSVNGIIPLSLTQDTPGPLARTVTDLAIGLDAMVGPQPSNAAPLPASPPSPPQFVAALRTDALRGARIGIFLPYFRAADPDVADTIRAAAFAMRALGADVVEVNMPDFDALIAGTSAIRLEHKFDFAEYLARPGGAPVKSLREIIDRGLFDASLEARLHETDTATSRDSESHRTVIARQAALRARILALMDSLHLDALAYPTSTRKPVLAGDPQLGATCPLASHTGLPAISMPAGFTTDGLPTGLEVLGRPFADARLVGFAYAFEHALVRRRAPPSTPALVSGRAPQPVAFSTVAGGTSGSARAHFTFDPLTSELAFRVQAASFAPGALQAVVIRRVDSAGPRVIQRLLGPGMPSAAGSLRVHGVNLDALHAGKLTLAVLVSTGDGLAGEAPLKLPR